MKERGLPWYLYVSYYVRTRQPCIINFHLPALVHENFFSDCSPWQFSTIHSLFCFVADHVCTKWHLPLCPEFLLNITVHPLSELVAPVARLATAPRMQWHRMFYRKRLSDLYLAEMVSITPSPDTQELGRPHSPQQLPDRTCRKWQNPLVSSVYSSKNKILPVVERLGFFFFFVASISFIFPKITLPKPLHPLCLLSYSLFFVPTSTSFSSPPIPTHRE